LTLTFDLLTLKVLCPYPVEHWCQFGIKTGSFTFKLSCYQDW